MRRFFHRKRGKKDGQEQDAGGHGVEVADSSATKKLSSPTPVLPKIPPYGMKTLVSGDEDKVECVITISLFLY
jgi:hypothetical protein